MYGIFIGLIILGLIWLVPVLWKHFDGGVTAKNWIIRILAIGGIILFAWLMSRNQ